MEFDKEHITKLSNKLINGILSNLSHVYINGDSKIRNPGNINMSFACVEGESLIMAIKEIAVSSGSACTSASLEPSYVLRALGVDEELAHTSLRIGIGRYTTVEEIDYAIKLISKSVKQLRELSPLWEMIEEGIDLKTIQWTQH